MGSSTTQPPEVTDAAGEYGTGAWIAPQLDPGTSVYHYTSPVGLVGIMTSRELWATEASGLNDLSEVKLGRRRIRKYLSATLEADPSDVVKMLNEVARREAFDREYVPWFILSASLERDDAAQWRLYTGARAGFAVHLDTSVPLQVIAGDGRKPHRYKTMGDASFVARWYKVAYTRKQQSLMLDDLLAWARRRYAEAEADWAAAGPDADDRLADVAGDLRLDLAAALDLASALIKPRSFRGEREVRAVAAVALQNLHVSFRANDHGVVRYLRLAGAPPGEDASRVMEDKHDGRGAPMRTLPVIGVTIGPTPYFKRARRTVEALLLRAGLKPDESFPIKKSKVPLRW